MSLSDRLKKAKTQRLIAAGVLSSEHALKPEPTTDESDEPDAGLEHLKGLVQVQELNLDSTQITDAGLKHLFATKPVNLAARKPCHERERDVSTIHVSRSLSCDK